MSLPKVSAVIPYYNNARTLRRCLLSFANEQTHKLHEIILVDDGSSEPMAAALAGLELDVPIRCLTSKHLGQSGATNVGLRAASGDVVLLTCADIVANNRFVAVHAEAHATARSRGEPVGVMGHIAYARWLKMTPFLRFLSEDGPQFAFGAYTNSEDIGGHLLYSPNFSVDREQLAAIGGFDETFPYGFQDTDIAPIRASVTSHRAAPSA